MVLAVVLAVVLPPQEVVLLRVLQQLELVCCRLVNGGVGNFLMLLKMQRGLE